MKRVTLLGLVFVLLLSACNMPVEEETAPEIATAAALTVEAALSTTPLASPTIAAQNNAEPTPTFSQPMASFEDVTNCRTGPGVNYQRITQIRPDESVEIIGFFPPNYWVVNTDAGSCWVSGEFVTPSGSTSSVPTVTAPPTPLGGDPDAPSFAQSDGWSYFCYDSKADIVLKWVDKSTNETGYRVLRNGEVAAELPANSTSYAETINLLSGQSVGYQIQAFNEAGQSTSNVATMTCP
jgi:uncharacterized protein YraI